MDKFYLEGLVDGICQVAEEGLQVKHRTQAQTSFTYSALIVIRMPVQVTIERGLQPILQWSKQDRNRDREDNCLKNRDDGALEARQVMKCFCESEECGGGYDNYADIYGTVTDNELNIRETVSNDRVRDNRDH